MENPPPRNRHLSPQRVLPQSVMRKRILPASLGLVLWWIAAGALANGPNIVFILADDLAWSDLGCYGHRWHDTPHMDALAENGMRFTQGYAPAPICSASRASILTGKTTARLHFEFVTKNEAGFQKIDGDVPLKTPPFTLNLPLAENTIPERLSALGYETGFFGKWHLNAHHQRYLGWSPTHGPPTQGFQTAQEDFGSHPYSWGKKQPAAIRTVGEFPHDSMIERSIAWMKQKREQPFFLLTSLFHVHTPVRTRCEWLVEKYDAKIPQQVPKRKQRVTYAAFVEELDHHVGQILSAIREAGLEQDTLVVFTSDNGGHPEYTGNAPLRGSKWNLYEGGVRVPLMIRWPGRIDAGALCNQPAIGYDLLPTLVEVAGGDAPKGIEGKSLVDLFADPSREFDRELVWHFPYYHPERGYRKAQGAIGIDDFAVSKTHPQSAIRVGRFKLLHDYETERTELYDLNDDLGEQQDLSAEHPEHTARLRARLDQRLRDVDARLPQRS